MKSRVYRHGRFATAVLVALVMVLVVFQAPGASQSTAAGRGTETASLTYTRGQPVVPVFFGWKQNPDGTADMLFSYINRNWQEELDIPIGPDNNIQPAPFGPDGGQPTHFLPRVNRWQFGVRVPKDFGSKEIVWTLTSHGQTHRTYGTLNPGYLVDDFLIMFEFGNAEGPTAATDRVRPRPTLHVEGEDQRTVKVGQPTPLVAVATALPTPEPGAIQGSLPPRRAVLPGTGAVGNAGGGRSAVGLRFAWYVYRGAGKVTFDPPMPFKVWEDPRRGSPYSPGWRPPPVPPGNKWVHNVTFHQPGTYVLRAEAHDGYLFSHHNVTFNVTP